MSQPKMPPRLPAIAAGTSAIVLVLYFAFFRGHTDPTPTAAAAEAPAMAVQSIADPPPESRPEPKVEPKADPKPEPVAAPAPPPPPAPPASTPLRDFQRLYEEGKWREARRALVPIFADCDDKTRLDLAAKAIEINQKLLVTHPDDRDVEMAEVQNGDSLIVFARRFKQFHGEYGIVKLVNNIRNDANLRSGAKLRVPKGNWSIVVDKSLFTLWLCYEGTPFKAYKVCIGADDKTPAGTWTIGIKNPKPAWYAPPEWLDQEKLKNPIPYGHPKNPL